MLRVFYGNDVVAARKAAHDHVASKSQDMSVTLIDTDVYQKGIVAEAAGGVSLFGGVSVYILDMPSADVEFNEEVLAQLEALAGSAHEFVVIEGTLLVAAKKPYAKHAEAMEEFKRTSEQSFNVFSMADALSRKDKKSLWLLLHDAFRAGLSSEEIIGTLWWQLKTLRLATVSRTAAEAGMKDFPFNKAKRSLAKFADGELESLSQSLLSAYHNARLGKLELDLALERWVLTL